MDDRIKDFCDYLDRSHSAYHAQANLASILDDQGYTQLKEGESWKVTPGGRYYVCRGGATVIAFRVPEGRVRGFLISAAHTDRPSLKLKENGEKAGAYTSLGVERYGGMLMAPWLDRPLSIAGRVLVETEQGAQAKLIDIDRDLLLIPNVAIHMNRQANDGYKWNPVMDMNPLIGGKSSQGKLLAAGGHHQKGLPLQTCCLTGGPNGTNYFSDFQLLPSKISLARGVSTASRPGRRPC